MGPRQSGKSTLIRNFLSHKKHWEVNLLIQRVFLKYSKDPTLFREEALFQIQENKIKYIFVDEIQKLPPLLDEIHQLIEETKCYFILSGSSARELKRTHANLLGGRGKKELSGLLSFSEEFPECDQLICVCEESTPRISHKVQILPWNYFLQKKLPQLLS